MPKQIETRLYTIADADLKQLADKVRNSITRDLAQFNTRNITNADVAAFDTLIGQFDNGSTDVEMIGDNANVVLKKDALATQIQVAIRPIRNMADITYNGVGKYKIFGFEDMSNLTDNELYRLVKRVVRVATSLMADLMPKGLTTQQLTNLDAMGQSFDKAIDDVAAANENRDLHTQDRIVMGNALWAQMGILASIGQSLFADVDEARYNDYVLIGSRTVTAASIPPVK